MQYNLNRTSNQEHRNKLKFLHKYCVVYLNKYLPHHKASQNNTVLPHGNSSHDQPQKNQPFPHYELPFSKTQDDYSNLCQKSQKNDGHTFLLGRIFFLNQTKIKEQR